MIANDSPLTIIILIYLCAYNGLPDFDEGLTTFLEISISCGVVCCSVRLREEKLSNGLIIIGELCPLCVKR